MKDQIAQDSSDLGEFKSLEEVQRVIDYAKSKGLKKIMIRDLLLRRGVSTERAKEFLT